MIPLTSLKPLGYKEKQQFAVGRTSSNSPKLPVAKIELMFYNGPYLIWRRAVYMTREEVYRMALKLSGEERTEFKAFLSALLESGDTAQPPASDPQESA